MNNVEAFLHQVAGRYRRALLMKTGLLAGLMLGVLGVMAWRLSARGLSPLWSVGGAGAIAVSVIGGLVWWMRRRWMSPRGTAAYLDQTFDLQQRLITAEEYSRMASPPALYSLLAKEVAERCSTKHPRFPQPLDHTAGLWLVALLLVLFWPAQGMIRQPFAQRVSPPPTPSSSPESPQRPPQPKEPSSAASSSSQSSQAPSSTSGPPSSSASSARSQRGTPSGAGQSASGHPSGDRGSPSQRSRDGNASSSTSDGQAGGAQPSSQAQTAQPSSPDGQPSNSAGRDGRSTDQMKQLGDAAGASRADAKTPPSSRRTASSSTTSLTPQAASSQRASRSTTDKPQSAKSRPSNSHQGQPSQAQGSAADSTQRAGHQTNASTAQEQGAAPSQQPGAGGGSASPANQEAMRGEIQRLLKEVSGELQQLQVQLASAQRQPQPEAGTGSDPELFESPMPDDGNAGTTPVPFVLPTDTAATKTSRPSAGVGRPEGEVSRATPQMGREDVSLSDQPAEEIAPSARQPIPPEYRGVFDRLQHDLPPGEQNP